MERRHFLKTAAGAFFSALGWLGTKKAHAKPVQMETLPFYCQPADLFQPVKMEPGVACEFPLDFVSPVSYQTVMKMLNYRVVSSGIERDYVMVPTWDLTVDSELSAADAMSQWQLKLNTSAADLLTSSVVYHAVNNLVIPGRETDVYARLTQWFGKNVDVRYFRHEWKGKTYLVGVDARRLDTLVMPVREEPNAFRDHPALGGKWHCWGEQGLAVLTLATVAAGHITTP